MPHLRLLAAVSLALVLAAPAGAAGGWTWPVNGSVITPFRNGADPYAGGQHRGIDIGAPARTAVRAATAGTVRFAGVAGSSGLTVSIRTADGSHDTSYLHLARANVREGDRVRAGDRVGAVGTSGRRSASAPHLHFGVREAGGRHAYLDPLRFLPPVAAPRSGPRGAPAPMPAPVRARLAPEPARRRAPRPVSVPGRPRVRVPAGRRLPRPGPARAPLPGIRPVPAPAPAGRRAPLPRLGPEDLPSPAPVPAPAPAAPEPAPEGPPAAAGGPDLGLALACLGLLAAAACLGTRSGDGRPRAEQGRRALRALLRPLTGR